MEKLKLIIVIISFWTQVNCFKMREKFQERKEEADVEVVTDPELDAECRIDQECVPIRSCEPVLQLLMNVKDEPKDSKWRSHTVNVVRERICGELAQNMICCPRDGFYDQNKHLASFEAFFYDVGGEVFLLDSQSLIIENFTYEGVAPDAFLIGGLSGEPNDDPDVILAFPFEGDHFVYSNRSIPVWRKFDGTRSMVLTMPPNINVLDLKWLSIWCRAFGVNFGQAIF